MHELQYYRIEEEEKEEKKEDLKELVQYQNSLKEMNLEELLAELDQQIQDGEYHKLCSRNDELKKKCEDKIQLIKMRIVEIF